MIENIVNKLKSNEDNEELAAIQKQIEDTIGTEEFANYMERRRKARIRNIAIAVGTSAVVIGAALWVTSKTSSSDDETADDSETETPEED